MTTSFGGWNSDPPFDPEHYGVTLSLVGEKADRSIVGKYTDPRDKGVIAQIIRVRDEQRKEVNFKLDKTTRMRVTLSAKGATERCPTGDGSAIRKPGQRFGK